MDANEKLLKADDGAALRFWWGTDRNNFQSEAQDRPVYDEVLYLEILTPGSRESSPVYEVIRRYPEDTGLGETKNASVFERYRPQIEHYMANKEDNASMAGTPLDRLTFLERSQIASLQEGRIYTVEGLAALSDEKLRVLGMEGRTLRGRAQAYIDEAKGGEAVAGLTQQVADLTGKLDVLLKRAEDAEAALAAAKGADTPKTVAPPPASKAVEKAPAKVDGDDII